MDSTGNETLEFQASGPNKNFGSSAVVENSASQAQVNEKNFAEKIRMEVDIAVMVVENQVRDAVLTAMDNVVMPRV